MDLLKIDVSGFTEKKNGLTYLSWAHAWAEALKADPAANFHVESFQQADGTTMPYMDVHGTGMVWVRVTMFGKPITCFLPIMDHRNKPISDPDAFQVNTAIMRCLTKALAFHGLGLNIYAGEDLPMVVDEKPEPKPEPKAEPKEEHKGFWAKPSENASEPSEKHQLFADGLIQATQVCKSLAGLKSLWKSNQTALDDLEKGAPDLFKKVKDTFATIRLNMEQANGKQ